VKAYQGNRVGKDKPPILEALREAMADPQHWLPEFTVTLNREVEADDAMMHEAYRRKELGVIRSDDKDLRMTPYPYYDIKTGQVRQGVGFGFIEAAFTEGGQLKCVGQGRKFFWAQMLMGDSADNVQGIIKLDGRLCGTATTLEFLRDYTDESETANAVVSAYRAINQNPLPEAYMLWLQRWPKDHVWEYLRELRWTEENVAFLVDCYKRDLYDDTTEDSDPPE
jgi:hypothetical protein